MRPGLWLALGLMALALVVYSPLFEADFTSRDDEHTVARNPAMVGPIAEVGSFWTNLRKPVGDIYIPATQTLWYGLAQIARRNSTRLSGPLDPLPFHVANIVIHLFTGQLVFALIRRLVKSPTAAALGAAVFLVHPLQVEAVGWVSGLKDVFSGALVLLSLYAYLRYVEATLPRRADDHVAAPARWRWYALATVAFALAMLAKPAAVITPLLAIILCLGAIVLESRDKKTVASRHHWKPVLPNIFLPLLPWFAMTIPIMLEGRRVQPATIVPDVALWARPIVAADALCFYLWKLVAPASLAADYARTPSSIMQSGAIYWTWIVPCAVLGLAVWYRKRWPALLLAVLLFFAAPLPVLGLVKFVYQFFSTVSDHYVYVAMLGPALAAAVIFERFHSKRLMRWGSAVVVGALCVLSFMQAGYWKSDFELTGHIVDVTPHSRLGHLHLARLYADRGFDADAMEHYQQAVAIAPSDRDAREAFGNLLLKLDRNAEAAEQFRAGLQAFPDDPGLHVNLGVALAKQKLYPEARAQFEQAVRLKPDDAAFYVDLGRLSLEQKDFAGASAEFRRALQIDPTFAPAKEGLQKVTGP